MIKIAICDDDPVLLERANKLIACQKDYSPCETRTFLSGELLISAITEGGWLPDIVFMDIVFGGNNTGIAVAKELNLICPSCSIIFLTGHLLFAPDVYETRHSYFILKSRLEEKIGVALERAYSDMGKMEYIHLHNSSEDVILPVNELLFMERELKKTLVAQSTGDKYIVTAKPSDLIAELKYSPIIRCHQSYWVNMDFVSKMSADSFLLNNGTEIPISRSFRAQVKDAFHNYLTSSTQSRVL